MDLKLLINYRMDLTREEWLVVNKALRMYAGQHPDEQDGAIAAALQEQMLQQKHNTLSQMTTESAKHVTNVEKGRKS